MSAANIYVEKQHLLGQWTYEIIQTEALALTKNCSLNYSLKEWVQLASLFVVTQMHRGILY